MKKLEVILTDDFRRIMYNNMWQWMNLDVIKYIMTKWGYSKLKYTKIDDVYNEKFTKEYVNSICFKGDETNGHYVYVSNILNDETGYYEPYGTYERGILCRKDDDGICHGTAMIYAINFNNSNKKNINIDIPEYKLINFPKNTSKPMLSLAENYINILQFYMFLIGSGIWDEAVNIYFPNELKNRPEQSTRITRHNTDKYQFIKSIQSYIAYRELERYLLDGRFEVLDGDISCPIYTTSTGCTCKE